MNNVAKVLGLALVLAGGSTGNASAATVPAPLAPVVTTIQHIGGPTTGPVKTGPQSVAPVAPISGPVPSMTRFVESEISVISNFLLGLANIGKAGV